MGQTRSGGPPSLSDLPTKLHESERADLIALRKEVRQIKLERDILAKATVWFANNGDQTFTPSTR